MAGTSIALSQVLALPDVLMTDRFRLDFSSLPTTSQTSGNPLTNGTDLAIRCQQCVIPGRQIEPVEVSLNGHTTYYRGRGRFPGVMGVTYVEFRDMATTSLLRGWQELVVGTDSGDGLSKNFTGSVAGTLNGGGGYARNARLTVHNENGDEAASFIVVNCWPNDIMDVNLDGMAAQAMLVTAQFQYDYIVPATGMWNVQNIGTLNQIIGAIGRIN